MPYTCCDELCSNEIYLCVHVCVCMSVFVCLCVYVCVYASALFKYGKGSFTQCILVHVHKNPASWCILCELSMVWAKRY